MRRMFAATKVPGKADENTDFVAPDYTQAINFKVLAASNKDFRDCMTSNHGRMDFKDAEHLRCLTKALLLRDFKVQLHLPADRLCPPVPIRWLYVQWIQQLVETTRPDLASKTTTISGLDIGVGSSCIYPLLVCASKSTWRIYGTDIDDTNYQHAVHNVSLNDWDDRIKLLKTQSESPLLPLDSLQVEKLDFTMCNPPFFATKEEALATFAKDQQPFAACTGADVEMITPGGETAYIRRIIEESLVLRDRIRWCTVQLGKLSSLHALVKMLKEEFGCMNWVVNVLQPSGQTVRWVLGWSWMPYRAPDDVARHKSLVGTGLQQEPNEMSLAAGLVTNPEETIKTELTPLPLQVDAGSVNGEQTSTLLVRAESAVWSRAARRKRQREMQDGTSSAIASTRQELLNAFKVSVVCDAEEDEDKNTFSVLVRWTKGQDRAIFESFCGMLKRKITTAND